MTSDEFLAAIYDFVDGEMEFSRFLDWFGAVLPEIEESGDPLVVETAAQLRLSLAEYGRGHRPPRKCGKSCLRPFRAHARFGWTGHMR